MKLMHWFSSWWTRSSAPAGKRRRQASSTNRSWKLWCEVLEDRITPTTNIWINANGGNWDTAANWSTGSVPGAGDDAVINTAAAATITIHGGDTESVHSL